MSYEIITSIDIGSSGVKASAYTTNGKLISFGRSNYITYYDRPGWAEQDPKHWRVATNIALRLMLKGLTVPYEIKGIALTGQCPTYLPVDRNIEPLERAYTYQDNRAVQEVKELEEIYGSDLIHSISGHKILAFYILPKILWQKKNRKDLFNKIALVLQPRDYIAYYLTGELATEETHANATLLYDLRQHKWNEKLIKELGLKIDIFPKMVLKPWHIVGTLRKEVADNIGHKPGIPVIIGAADSQCCCLGVGATKPEILSEMSGTSTCLNNTVLSPVQDINVGNYAHVIPDVWCTEIGLNATGVSLEWLTSILYCEESNKYSFLKEKLKEVSPGSEGLIFIPYLAGGERDNPLLKGGFYNLNLSHGAGHLANAVMEGVSFAIRERVEILNRATCVFSSVRISGGGALLDEWNQIKSNVLGIPVFAIKDVDGAELGAAMLAGIGAGIFKNHEEAIENCAPIGKEFYPDMKIHEYYDELYNKFLNTEKKFL